MDKNRCDRTNKLKLSKIEAMIYLANSEFLQKKHHFKHRRKETRFYECEFCGFYHLTSQSKNRKEF